MATKSLNLKKKTNEEAAAPVPVADNPVEAKLDKVIELLEKIAANAQNIPFQGLDCSKLIK